VEGILPEDLRVEFDGRGGGSGVVCELGTGADKGKGGEAELAGAEAQRLFCGLFGTTKVVP